MSTRTAPKLLLLPSNLLTLTWNIQQYTQAYTYNRLVSIYLIVVSIYLIIFIADLSFQSKVLVLFEVVLGFYCAYIYSCIYIFFVWLCVELCLIELCLIESLYVYLLELCAWLIVNLWDPEFLLISWWNLGWFCAQFWSC